MFLIGLDLGQRHDHSALVIVEKPFRHALSTMPRTLHVRMAMRIPLGTPYPEVVEIVRWIVAMANQRRLADDGLTRLVVDATNLGRPIVDLLRQARLDCLLVPVTITGGDRQNRRSGESEAMNVPKQDLIAGLQMALEKGELRLSKTMKELGALKRELMDVRLNRRPGGTPQFGAEAYGQHDDLVIALALAVWQSTRR
jgi:hypothetical protein